MRYVIVTAMLLASCTQEKLDKMMDEMRKEEVESLYYIKDTRPEPDICYATLFIRTTSGVLATVPCASVEHLMKQ